MKLEETSCFKRTICEVHREIWDFVEEMEPGPIRDELMARIKEAFNMAKRMDKKLREYKADWFKGFYKDNPNWKDAERRRRERQDAKTG